MKRSKKVIGALFVSAVVIGSSLTTFAAIEKLGFPSNTNRDTTIFKNHVTARGLTDCSSTPCQAFIGITNTITASGVDFTDPEVVASSGTPTCQVFSTTNDPRGYVHASTKHRINLIEEGEYVNYTGTTFYPS